MLLTCQISEKTIPLPSNSKCIYGVHEDSHSNRWNHHVVYDEKDKFKISLIACRFCGEILYENKARTRNYLELLEEQNKRLKGVAMYYRYNREKRRANNS